MRERVRYEMVECCHNCEHPKVPTPGDDWMMCANPDCVAFGEAVASACFREKPVHHHTRGDR